MRWLVMFQLEDDGTRPPSRFLAAILAALVVLNGALLLLLYWIRR